ncbi:hypothetical protein [Streptomyces johnsoniae]|uniref:Uncharacterized protein n=1 Tax=Streptomyces johnsoniae TaxID=3075532 RepID=A0ABU2S3V0_9ACTN|nr:hypothetical protein [Streptomyces sp. DSM 41886]MDT0442290.1 hypothetical protein [Streptomyces sp. DSM 41886]
MQDGERDRADIAIEWLHSHFEDDPAPHIEFRREERSISDAAYGRLLDIIFGADI